MSPSENTSRLDLIVEPIDTTTRRRDASELAVLEINPGVHALRADVEAAQLRFDAAADAAEPIHPSELRFEAIVVAGRAVALVHCPRALSVRVNGGPAGSLLLLHAGDELQLDCAVLHAVEFVRCVPGPPAPQHVGRICGVCRTPVSAATRIYVHSCQAVMHLECEPTPADQRLECALLTDTCPVCERSISLQSGYLELPEL